MLLTSINVLFEQHLKHIFIERFINSREPQPSIDLGLPDASLTSKTEAPRSGPRSLGCVFTGRQGSELDQLLSALTHTASATT